MSDPSDKPAAGGAAALSPLKRAFLALEDAQAKIASLEQAAREPIAIIGLGCRVPGGGDAPESFWNLMREGRDAIGPQPADRWDVDAFFDPDPEVPGKIATRSGGFLGPIDRFEPELFGISPREAQGMDPQQRLFLEVAWEALENAGQAPDRLERSITGVYVGLAASDYAYLQLKTEDPALLDAHFTSGIAHSIVSGRLSYLLGLQGPSITIDTACSSSLVAIHLACQALRAKDCRMAIAGGVNLILSPDLYIALSHSRMLAPDGRCKTFDAAADGFARGEGCGVVVLKRLSDARADGDRILALIRGSAVNQDGPSGGLTAPNGPAQEAVIREAIARAGLSPKDVGFIEAHGTGTQLGDPLEVQALGAVFEGRDAKTPLLIGSVKTNIGHLEAAAGVTGLIKIVLSLRNRQIPAHLHFKTPSPHIGWADLPLKVPTTLTPWEPIGGRRIGGVSSFGFSGTNAHVILEEAPAETAPAATTATGPARAMMTLSARDERALRAQAKRWAAALEGRTDADLRDVCFTANVGRARFAERAVVFASSMAELRSRLVALSEGAEVEGVRRARVTRRDPAKVAFLYTGQGAQYAGMAKGLYEALPVFREALDRCAEILTPHLERPLLDVIFAEPGSPAAKAVDETAYTQPALFAVECALTELWRSWGVTPNAVMGHSVGEYVAACVAGVLSLEDALVLIAKRGRWMQSLPPGGTMAAIAAPEAKVAPALAPFSATVSIAAVNAPEQTVIAGAAADVDAVCNRFAEQGVRTKALVVSHAFHSPLTEPILDAFEADAKTAKLSPPKLRLISNLTGKLADAGEIVQPRYWRRHVREAVRFGDGLASLAALKPDILVEIGPQATLLAFASAVFGDGGPLRVGSLKKGQDDATAILDALASLYLDGADVDLRGLDRGQPRRIVDLPTYPFQRERYWYPTTKTAARKALPKGAHPLLGARLRAATAETVFESSVTADAPGFVRHHRVQDHVIMPATAYLETLHAAARQVLRTESASVESVTVKEAMLLADDGAPRTMQVVCAPPQSGVVHASLSSLGEDDGDDAWTGHVTAELRAAGPRADGPTLASLRAKCTQEISAEEHYRGFEERGLAFGDRFRTVRRLWSGPGEALGEVSLSDACSREAASYRMHPVLLDGCFQVIDAALRGADGERALYLPIGIGRYTLHESPGTRAVAHVAVRPGGGETQHADLRIFDGEGALVAEVAQLQLKKVAKDALARIGERWLDDCLFETTWRPIPADAAKSAWDASVLPALGAAAERAQATLRRSSDLDAYDGFHPRLEALSGAYVVQAMRRLGWAPAAGETFDETALAEKLRVVPKHRRLFGRFLAILAEDGLLTRSGERWTCARPLPDVAPERDHAALAGSAPAGARAELELTSRLGAKLAEGLRNEIDPLELLFPGGSLGALEEIYRDSPTAKFWNGLMAEIVGAAAAARAEGRTLRILEVGAGTGGTTAHVVPKLPTTNVEYTFTDVGPLFVARARERFGGHGFLRFQTLDLERDLEAQGLSARSFDLVIASNVIHATKDLRATLDRVRRLLVPGGMLAMLEVTAPQRWFDLTVGFTEGWWAFVDADLRKDYATLTRAEWLALLADRGFEATTVPAAAPSSGALTLQSIFLSRAGARTARDWLLFADKGGLMRTLATRLRDRGDRCTLVHAGTSFDASTDDVTIARGSSQAYRQLLGELRSRGRRLAGVLHAWSLDSAGRDTLTTGSLAEAEAQGPVSGMLLAQALVAENSEARLWFVTRGGQEAMGKTPMVPAQAPVWGLAKAIRLEHPELGCTCVDLDPGSDDVGGLLAELDASGAEQAIALRGGERHGARLSRVKRPAKAASSSLAPYRLAPKTPGAIESLGLIPAERRAPGPGEVEIAVEATGLNFKDVLNVLGMYPGNAGPLGGESAGRVVAVGAGVTHLAPGDDVVALIGGSFASHVTARAAWVQKRPAGMSAEEGASIPIAYVTADFCLNHLAKMRAGDRVLIHAAAGGVGMAGVRLAQRAGVEIFATAGSAAKRDLLRSMGVTHVLDSRSPSFADEVMTITGGKGVDLVLNSLAGELIDASFRVLAKNGRFVEMGKRGIKDHAWVESLGRGLEYFIVDWGETGEKDPALIGGMLARLMDGIRRGEIAPLPRHVFELAEADRAFRFMAQARHTGKIVVRHGAKGAPSFRRDGTYLITGGLAGLGPTIGKHLAERGAGRIVLVSRRGVTPEVGPLLDAMRAHGAEVVTEALDVADETALRALLARLRKSGPPIRGVLHGAGVLDNAALLQQDADRFARVFAPKVKGGYLLDTLTRCDPLDGFVLFSSAAAVLGARGQANHSAANAFLDLLAHERRSLGLPALSIDWGAWTEIGAAAGAAVAEHLSTQGLGALTPAQGIAALDRAMSDPAAQLAVIPIDWPRYLAATESGKVPAFLAEVAGNGEARPTTSTAKAAAKSVDLQKELAAAPKGRWRPMVTAFVRERALKTLGVDPARAVDPRTPLGELGLDSLLAVELRNALSSALGKSLPASLLFDYPTLETLTEHVLTGVLGLQDTTAKAPPPPAAPAKDAIVGSIEDLSDEEVDRLLAARAGRQT